jgi:hypothetical protein
VNELSHAPREREPLLRDDPPPAHRERSRRG